MFPSARWSHFVCISKQNYNFPYLLLEAVTGSVLLKRVFLENFAKFTGKYRCQSLFFNEVGGLRPAATLLKKKSGTAVFL